MGANLHQETKVYYYYYIIGFEDKNVIIVLPFKLDVVLTGDFDDVEKFFSLNHIEVNTKFD